MKRSILIIFALVLALEIFLSSKFIYFTNDDGNGNHTGGKNPQTSVVWNVQSQELNDHELNLLTIVKRA